jgi:hypothetical protein
LGYLLSIKEEILKLPTSHKSSTLTIQRIVLLILPLLKSIENSIDNDKSAYEHLKN